MCPQIGKNFGFDSSLPVSITIGNISCLSPTWLNDGLVTCASVRDVVGPKNVSILAANQTAPVTLSALQNALVSMCVPGYYGTAGLLCAVCPLGLDCPGSELYKSRVSAQGGFWMLAPGVATAAQCPPERQGLNLASCAYAVACSPNASCLPGNVCAEGYTGDRCSLCADGFFRANGICSACPSSPYAIIIIFIVGGIAALAVSYGLNKSGISLTLIAVGIDYAQVRLMQEIRLLRVAQRLRCVCLQVLAIFMSANVAWPATLMSLFKILSAFNFNLDLTSCVGQAAACKPPPLGSTSALFRTATGPNVLSKASRFL